MDIAAQRADELLEQGDIDGYAIWLRIGTAIETLTRGRREDESLNRGGLKLMSIEMSLEKLCRSCRAAKRLTAAMSS
jgi:hypothetical protein